jgi:hypothetical protein
MALNAGEVIALVAVIISLGALGVAGWQTQLTRRHNRLSVKPHLRVRRHGGGSQGRYGLCVWNYGIGPAIVQSVEVFVGNERTNDVNGDGGFNDALRMLDCFELLGETEAIINALAPDDALLPGQSWWLLYIPATADTKGVRDQFASAIQQIRLRIVYESVYRETWTVDEMS